MFLGMSITKEDNHVNLTQLRKKYGLRKDKTAGRKKPCTGDLDRSINPAPYCSCENLYTLI